MNDYDDDMFDSSTEPDTTDDDTTDDAMNERDDADDEQQYRVYNKTHDHEVSRHPTKEEAQNILERIADQFDHLDTKDYEVQETKRPTVKDESDDEEEFVIISGTEPHETLVGPFNTRDAARRFKAGFDVGGHVTLVFGEHNYDDVPSPMDYARDEMEEARTDTDDDQPNSTPAKPLPAGEDTTDDFDVMEEYFFAVTNKPYVDTPDEIERDDVYFGIPRTERTERVWEATNDYIIGAAFGLVLVGLMVVATALVRAAKFAASRIR